LTTFEDETLKHLRFSSNAWSTGGIESRYNVMPCKMCTQAGFPDEFIFLKHFETVELLNHDMFAWKQKLIRRWFEAFNADAPDRSHEHKFRTNNDEEVVSV